MNIKNTHCEPAEDKMCKSCALFYGAEAFQGLCSSCHKKNQKSKKQEVQPKIEETKISEIMHHRKQTADEIKQEVCEPAIKQQEVKKRCYDCKKKVGLLGIECKCGFIYCNKHRLPQDHACSFDHEGAAKKKLQKEIVKVYNGKIKEI